MPSFENNQTFEHGRRNKQVQPMDTAHLQARLRVCKHICHQLNRRQLENVGEWSAAREGAGSLRLGSMPAAACPVPRLAGVLVAPLRSRPAASPPHPRPPSLRICTKNAPREARGTGQARGRRIGQSRAAAAPKGWSRRARTPLGRARGRAARPGARRAADAGSGGRAASRRDGRPATTERPRVPRAARRPPGSRLRPAGGSTARRGPTWRGRPSEAPAPPPARARSAGRRASGGSGEELSTFRGLTIKFPQYVYIYLNGNVGISGNAVLKCKPIGAFACLLACLRPASVSAQRRFQSAWETDDVGPTSRVRTGAQMFEGVDASGRDGVGRPAKEAEDRHGCPLGAWAGSEGPPGSLQGAGGLGLG